MIHDFRSDTVTRPSAKMRAAMAAAEVGDAVMNDDPTTLRLEALGAEIMGKEAALFFPSGTQSNLAGLMAHCGRGDEYIVGQEAHTYKYEAGGAAVLGSIQPQPLSNQPDGSLSLQDIAAAIKEDDFHYAMTRLLALENTIGGKVLPEDYLKAATDLARERGLATHLDGARVMNAAVASGLEPAWIGQWFDSVSICLSKGLCAPVGSLLVGPQDYIEKARRIRKMVGGGMRQTGVLAAAGIIALEDNISRLAEDHALAEELAKILAQYPALGAGQSQTNMVFIHPKGLDVPRFIAFMKERGILLSGDYGTIRWVTHLDLSQESLRAVDEACAAYFKA